MSKKKKPEIDSMGKSALVFRPPGLEFPTKMRELWQVVIYCQEKKRVTFVRRQVETRWTDHGTYTERTYPRSKGIYKQIKPKHGASVDDINRLRKALKTMNFKPSINLEKNLEVWRVNDGNQ